jgi:hypothetical protein
MLEIGRIGEFAEIDSFLITKMICQNIFFKVRVPAYQKFNKCS